MVLCACLPPSPSPLVFRLPAYQRTQPPCVCEICISSEGGGREGTHSGECLYADSPSLPLVSVIASLICSTPGPILTPPPPLALWLALSLSSHSPLYMACSLGATALSSKHYYFICIFFFPSCCRLQRRTNEGLCIRNLDWSSVWRRYMTWMRQEENYRPLSLSPPCPSSWP